MSARPPSRPEGSLAGRCVLLTRSPADNAPLRTLLEAKGTRVLEMPAVSVEPLPDPGPLDSVLRRLSDYDWIAFTSRNAVRAVVDRLVALGASLPPTTRVAAVGPATGSEAERSGIEVDVVAPEASAGSLAGALAERVAGRRVFLPVGDLARHELQDGLRAAGASVDSLVVYRTVAPPAGGPHLDMLRAGEIDMVALASPSAARNLVAMLGGDASCLGRTKLACIGSTTAAALGELGLEPDAVAQEQSVAGLAEAILTCAKEIERARA